MGPELHVCIGAWNNHPSFLCGSSPPSFKMALSFRKDRHVLNLIAGEDGAMSAKLCFGSVTQPGAGTERSGRTGAVHPDSVLWAYP